MYICYIDEAGNVGRFDADKKDSQPAFLLVGLILPQENLRVYTQEFVELKKKYFPKICKLVKHQSILAELKGSDIRQTFVKRNRNNIRHTKKFLAEFLSLIQKYDGKLIGVGHIKKPNAKSDPAAIYTSSLQHTCMVFQHFLEAKNALGSVICDSRDFKQNSVSSHGIFTQMYKRAGDAYPNIVDMPTFGDSRNHAGIQSADLLASSFLFPMAMHAYCMDAELMNVHIQPRYIQIRKSFRTMLSQIQYRYDAEKTDGSIQRSGGIFVRDRLRRQWGGKLFADPDKD